MLQRETRWASPCCNTSAIVQCFLLRRGVPNRTFAVTGSTESQPYPSNVLMLHWDPQPPFVADACPIPT